MHPAGNRRSNAALGAPNTAREVCARAYTEHTPAQKTNNPPHTPETSRPLRGQVKANKTRPKSSAMDPNAYAHSGTVNGTNKQKAAIKTMEKRVANARIRANALLPTDSKTPIADMAHPAEKATTAASDMATTKSATGRKKGLDIKRRGANARFAISEAIARASRAIRITLR